MDVGSSVVTAGQAREVEEGREGINGGGKMKKEKVIIKTRNKPPTPGMTIRHHSRHFRSYKIILYLQM